MPSNHFILCCPFSSFPQYFPASGSFLISQLFASGSQSIGASVSTSVLPMYIQGWCPLGLTGLIFLKSKGLSGAFTSTTVWNINSSVLSLLIYVQLSHLYIIVGTTIALIIQTSVSKVMSLLFNTLSRFIIAFLPRSKRLLIPWLQSLSTMILEPKKIKSLTVSIVSPSICQEAMGLGPMIFIFLNAEF